MAQEHTTSLARAIRKGCPFSAAAGEKSQDWGDYHFGIIQQRNRGVLQAKARSRSVVLQFKLCVVAQAIMACPAALRLACL